MKFFARLLLLLTIVGAAAATQAQSKISLKDAAADWQFASIGGGFSITLPNQPDVTQPVAPNKGENIAGAGFIYAWDTREGIVSAMYIDISSPLPSGARNNAAFFKGFINGVIGGLKNGRLLASADIKNETHDGIEFSYESTDLKGVAQAFLVGKRLYFVNTMLSAEFDAEKTARRTLGTFKIGKQTEKTIAAPSKKL